MSSTSVSWFMALNGLKRPEWFHKMMYDSSLSRAVLISNQYPKEWRYLTSTYGLCCSMSTLVITDMISNNSRNEKDMLKVRTLARNYLPEIMKYNYDKFEEILKYEGENYD